MSDWCTELGGDLQFFYVLGIVAGLFLLIQFILIAIGFGDFDLEMDAESGDADLGVISVRTVAAFFFGFGWTGVAVLESDNPLWLAAVLGLVVGGLLMAAVAYLIRAFYSMRSSGSLDYANAVGATGSVYIRIPANHGGAGKVELVVQGRLTMVDALTALDREIEPHERVRVVSQLDRSSVLVEPLAGGS